MSEKVWSVEPEKFEIYKLAVEMADRVSARRGAANSYFLAVASALVVLAGFASGTEVGPSTVVRAISIAGLLLCLAWWLQLRSYRDLNTAKYRVIQDIEKELPLAIYCAEWEQLKQDPVKSWRKRYAELGFAERLVPVLFAGLFGFLVWTTL